MQITASELEAAFEPFQRIQGGLSELYMPPASPRVIERDDGSLAIVLQLYLYEERPGGGERTVRDIKEQEVYFVPAAYRDEPARVREYIAGWAAAVREVLEGWSSARASEAMPYDLADPKVLKLARAETAEDFRAALLKKSRLGKLLAP